MTSPQLRDSDRDPRAHAGVRLPPPLLFLGALVLGIVLEWLWPLYWLDSLPPPLRYWLGGGLFLAGAALLAAAIRLFRRAGTAIPPWEPSTALVTTGVYGLSRNPIYLGMILIYVGIAFVFAASWAFLLLLPVLIALQIEVIRREETYLERRFGEAYRQYRQEVRRWL
jgi:protein-S-isoprenylcysteine O-methyltransferase Ste14